MHLVFEEIVERPCVSFQSKSVVKMFFFMTLRKFKLTNFLQKDQFCETFNINVRSKILKIDLFE